MSTATQTGPDTGTEMKRVSLGFDLEIKADSNGTFEGHGAIFGNVDHTRDIIEPGAFRDTLQEQPIKKIKMLYNHEWLEIPPIGVWDEMREDDKGLFVRGRLLMDIQLGREVHAAMKAGAIDSLSIGYKPVQWEIDRDNEVRRLIKVSLFDVSPVVFPANEMATIARVKSRGIDHVRSMFEDIETERDMEGFLREVGASRSVAKAMASQWKHVVGQRDADVDAGLHDWSVVLAGLKRLNEQLSQN